MSDTSFQSLQNEFNATMAQYVQAQQDYISSLSDSGGTSVSGGASSSRTTVNGGVDTKSKMQQKSDELNVLNNSLMDLTRQLTNQLVVIEPTSQDQKSSQSEQKDQLNTIYAQLKSDRLNMKNELDEYQMISNQYSDNSIYVLQTNYQYMFWSFIAIIVVFYMFKMLAFPEADLPLFFWIGLLTAMFVFLYRFLSGIF